MKKSLSSIKKTFVIIILILIAQSSFAQQSIDLYGDYLGQTPPGNMAVISYSEENGDHYFPDSK